MYAICFPLKTKQKDEDLIAKRFRLICKVHNNVVSFAKKQLRKLHRDPEYRKAKRDYAIAANVSDEQDMRSAAKRMNDRIAFYELTREGLDRYVSFDQAKYKKHLTSHQCQKEAERVLAGVESVLYGKGEDVHYKKPDEFNTICGKSTTNGVKLYTLYHKNFIGQRTKKPGFDCIFWLGLQIPIKINWGDPYVLQAMQNQDVAYCEIQRRMFNDGWHYYVRIYFHGDAPKKLKPGKGCMGIDPGVSTVACVGKRDVTLRELAPEAKKYNKRIDRLMRQIDASKRQTNHEHYNEDGTIKRGCHKWKYSKTCQQKLRELKTLHRKKSAYIRQSHEELADKLISHGDRFNAEEMNYAALAKRSKKTEREDKVSEMRDRNGNVKLVRKLKKKKRYGKSVHDRAPSEFLTILQRKCDQHGLPFMKIDTRSFKASQLDHTTGEYKPVPLSQRFKMVAGHKVQRDLYSAFLIQNSLPDGSATDIKRCKQNFKLFVKLHDAEIQRMISNGISMKQCFGF